MKKITPVLLGSGFFIALFYHQEIGVNFSLLAILVWILLFRSAGKGRHKKPFRLLSAAVCLSALAFAWYGDTFSFFALYFSIIATGIYVHFPRVKPLLYPLLPAWNYLSFIFRVFFFRYWLPKAKYENKFWKHFLAFFLIPAIVGTAFISIYAAGSDLFSGMLRHFYIDFDFFSILFLAALGFFFMFNYWLMWVPREAIRVNQRLNDNFQENMQPAQGQTFPFLDQNFERKSGEISLIIVNLILLFFIFTYNYEQFFTEAGNLSQEIHQRVSTIIFSIVMAIGLLMFYFKSVFNFDPKAQLLKRLAFIWMALNTILILSAFLKNSEYIFHYGLTFKRIGVYIFLLLSLTGLFYSYLKIKHRRTNAYLANQMIRIFFGTFVLCSLINFSWITTRYNISFHKDQDSAYLQNMEYNQRILYNIYRQDAAWSAYFEERAQHIREEKNRPFLSSKLYYTFMNR